MAKQEMAWNQDTMSYRGVTSDGQIVDVTGDEYSESFSDGLSALTGIKDANDIPADLIEKYALAVYAEIDDPDTWAALADCNPNVEIVEK